MTHSSRISAARRIIPLHCQRKHTGCDPLCDECSDAMHALEEWLRPQLEYALMASFRSTMRHLGFRFPVRIPDYLKLSLPEVGLRATESAADYIAEKLRPTPKHRSDSAEIVRAQEIRT